jgi:hypothetical protein
MSLRSVAVIAPVFALISRKPENIHLPPVSPSTIKIEWTNIVGDPASARELKLSYGKPLHLNFPPP